MAQFAVEVSAMELFENSNIALQATLIDSKVATANVPSLSIAPVARELDLPLSFAQQRLWLVDQLQGSTHYNVQNVLRLKGHFDFTAFEKALQHLVQRHEILRTCYVEKDNQARQVIQAAPEFELRQVTLSSANNYQEVKQYIEEEVTQPFDLCNDIMVRAQVINLEDNENLLVLTIHHIAFDGVSLETFTKELATLYQACLHQEKPELPALAIQYADFAQWQRDWLSGDTLDEQLNFWREYLGDLPTVHNLPLDKARPSQQTYNGIAHTALIDAALSKQVRQFCRDHDVTLFVFLQTVFSVLLSGYSNEQDIVIGSPVASRTQPEIKSLIGFFVNTLVLRTDLTGNPEFKTLMARQKSQLVKAFEHQNMPFEVLVDDLKPERSTAHNALYQIVFAVQNFEHGSLDLGELTLEPFECDDVQLNVDYELGLHVTEKGSEIECYWSCNTSVFTSETLRRFADSMQTLLRGILANPQSHIQSLPLLSAEQEQSIVQDWNHSNVTFDRNSGICDLFEEQVAIEPDKIAAVFEDSAITYQELNEQANQVAGFLLENYVGQGSVVALCADRSLDMLVGLLGILKAGGAYLPIDPNLPEERIDFMLDDANVELVLTTSELMADLDFDDLKVLPLNANMRARLLARFSLNNPESSQRTGEQLAYVMYTSGSTGQPKGVMASHKNVVRLTTGAHEYIDIEEPLRVLLAAPISFDAATFEIWVPLLNGGTVCCYPHDIVDVNLINNTIEQHQVNLAWLTAGLFDIWVDAKETPQTPLRTIITGGDVVSAKSVKRLYDSHAEITVVNGYGPTECITFACCYVIPRDIKADQSLPIGKAIANTAVYILSEKGNPLPIGAVGELFIGGDAVSHGYLNLECLTSEKFIDDPFCNDDVARMYKTGDLGRWLPSGEIEYVGRIDQQVKVRGFRIELGEIEQQLNTCSGVKDCVVTYHNSSF